MSVKSNSSTRLRANIIVKRKTNIKSKWGIIGILRIVFLIAEIGLSLLMPFLRVPIAIAGAVASQVIDSYQYANLNVETRKRRVGSFILTTLINILPVAFMAKSAYGISKSVLKIKDLRTTKGFRYIVKGEQGFDSAYKASKINPAKYTRLTKVNVRQLRSTRDIPIEKFMTTNAQEKMLQNYFKSLPINYGKNNKYVANKDLSILRNLSNKLGKTTIDSPLSSNSISMMLRKMTPSARKQLTNISSARKLTANPQLLQNLEIISRINNPYIKTTMRDKINKIAVGKWFNYTLIKRKAGQTFNKGDRWRDKFQLKIQKFFWNKKTFTGHSGTQMAQLFNANDMGRELLNKPFNYATKFFKKKIINTFSKTILKEGTLFNKMVKKAAMKFGKWNIKNGIVKKGYGLLTKNFVRINENLKKHGKRAVIFLDQTFVMGCRIIQTNSTSTQVLIFFNPITTSAKTTGSKNFGGKQEFPAWISNAHLAYWRTHTSPGSFYLKGGSGFPPIAINDGGRYAISASFSGISTFSVFLSFIPLTALRNILSVISNFKNVGKEINAGVYRTKWKSTFVNTLERLLPNKVAKMVGGVAGAPFGRAVSSHSQRISRGIVKGMQSTKTTTTYVNGIKHINRRTMFTPARGFSANTLLKNSLPTGIKTQIYKSMPSYKNSRTHHPVGARKSGTRRAQTIRRTIGIFK